MNGYELTRDWFDFRFENPDKCRPIHTELYIYLVDQWNRLGQVNKFGLPTQFTMQVLNISSYNTYKKTIDDLIEFGFVISISEAKNQYQSRVIALSKNDKASTKALDKACTKAHTNASTKASDTIIEQLNNGTSDINHKHEKEKIDKASPKNYIIVWIEKHCPTLCKMKKPMTNSEAETLEKKFNTTEGLQLLRDTLLAMENKPTITKDYASTYLTCVNWMKRDNRYQSNKAETKIQRWKDPSEVYMCTDWIKRIPKPPNLNDDEACMDFIITWNIRELRKYQYEQTGTTNQIADYEE